MTEIRSESPATLSRVEHNPDAGAKRVVPRWLNPSTGVWSNVVPDLVSAVDYDFLDVQQTNSTTETYVFKTGGSGGTTIRTVTVVYTSSTKSDIDTVTWV